MTVPSIDIYQKLANFKKSYDDAYNKTSAIFNEPAKRLVNASTNPNITSEPVKIENVKTTNSQTINSTTTPTRTIPSRIIDLSGDRTFTTDPPSRISIRYREKRLANRRKRLIQRRPRKHIKTKK